MKVLILKTTTFSEKSKNNLNLQNSINLSELTSNNTFSNEYEKIENYAINNDENKFGYYMLKDQLYERITNFIIVLEKRISRIDHAGNYLSAYDGYIKFSEENILNFSEVQSTIFSSSSKIMNFVENYAGTEARVYDHKKEIVNAVKVFNKDTPVVMSKELGFNKDLTEFSTETLTITRNKIIETENNIRHSETWQGKKVGFLLNNKEYTGDDYLADLKKFVHEKYFKWESREVSVSALSFAMLPVLYPFLENKTGVKPYYLLIGPSGSGKTSVMNYMQKLYGGSKSLYNWTSSVASLTEIGHAHKDFLFILDDLKTKNFLERKRIDDAQALIQNYGDQSTRNRAKSINGLADNKYIRGMLMMSGEHIVFNEVSTIARGIIIKHKKFKTLESKQIIDKDTEHLRYFMPYFIQHVLEMYSKSKIQNLYFSFQKYLKGEVEKMGIEDNNLDRITNNIALLGISWVILRDFLYADDKSLCDKINYEFNEDLLKILKENIDRIQNFNPEILFERKLWELIEDEEIIIDKTNNEAQSENRKVLGIYKVEDDSTLNIGLKFNKIFNKIESSLGGKNSLGLSKKELKIKLIEAGKIRENNSGTVAIGNGIRGLYWIGNVPDHIKNVFFN